MALRSRWTVRKWAARIGSARRLLFTETGVWDELTNYERLAAERVWLKTVSDPTAAPPPPPYPAAAPPPPPYPTAAPSPPPDPTSPSPSQAGTAYVLAMFPYPSGRLHMGHVRVYAISDAVARFHRLLGKQVVHPMGWDAFGLPAENAALERRLAPDLWTRDNIAHMRGQLRRMACCFDWDRELATCDPQYYRWTQWVFLRLYRAGMVYRRQALVNWDPADGTVLADEQVDAQGRSWRSGALVERRLLRQWFVRTTRYSERLLRSLDSPELRDWRDVIEMQKHWIGPCDGWKFELKVESTDIPGSASQPEPLLLWTADPGRLLSASFIGVRPDHPLAQYRLPDTPDSTGLTALCPATGRRLPLLVSGDLPFPDGADAVLCTAQDGPEAARLAGTLKQTEKDPGEPPETGSPAPALSAERVVSLGGGYRCSSHLHDWLVSRQRYWGTPIPVVHCPSCGVVPLSEDMLPVMLPPLPEQRVPGRSPLQAATDWINTECPSCGGPAERETDTMDTFVDSSWYYLRFLDPHHAEAPFRPEAVNSHLPVDVYVGGKEHAVLHLYYARFVHHFLQSEGLVSSGEPFGRLLVQGQVMGQSYRVTETGRYLPPEQVRVTDSGEVVSIEDNLPVTVQWEKMSKSKHNGVDPAGVMDELGADTMRLLMLATVAPTSSRHWSTDSFPPLLAWQRRLWLTVGEFLRSAAAPSTPAPSETEWAEQEAGMREERNYFVRTVTHNFQETHQLSVAISRLQGLTTALRRRPVWYRSCGSEYQRALGDLIVMTVPVMPCLASEMWASFVAGSRHRHAQHRLDLSVLQQRWPSVDQDAMLELTVELNGQESAGLSLPRHQLDNLTREDALRLAQSSPSVARHIAAGVTSCHLQLNPGLGGVLRVRTERTAEGDEAERREVIRKRQERKLAKKEKREKRRQRKAERERAASEER